MRFSTVLTTLLGLTSSASGTHATDASSTTLSGIQAYPTLGSTLTTIAVPTESAGGAIVQRDPEPKGHRHTDITQTSLRSCGATVTSTPTPDDIEPRATHTRLHTELWEDCGAGPTKVPSDAASLGSHAGVMAAAAAGVVGLAAFGL